MTMTQTTDPVAGEREETQAAPPTHRRRLRRWRTRTPTVIQMESVECGAAALSTVLSHYGRHVPLEELRIACGVSRDGANAKNLLEAARSYGLEAKGFQADVDVLPGIRAPFIIFWAFQHFMVVEGVKKGRTVAVNDPATGPRRISWAEFDDGFTGIVLTFEPGPDFHKGGKRTRLIDALLRRRMPTGGAMSLVLLASLLLVALGLVGPAYFRIFIDRVLGAGITDYLGPLLAAMAATALGTFVLTSIQRHYLLRIEIRMALVSSSRFFRHLLRLPVEFYLQRQPAEVAKRVSVNDMVSEILSRDLAATGINLILVVFYGVVLVRYDVLLGVIGMGMALLNILVLHWVARARMDAVAKLRADQGKLTATTFNTLQLIETIKATGAEPEAFSRWSGFLAKVVTAKQRLGGPTALIATVPPLLATVNIGLILMVGGLRAVEGAISVGMLVAFQTLLATLSRPVTQLTELGERMQDITADLNRLHDVERYPEAPIFTRDAAADGARLDGYLEFRDVTFSYGPLTPAVIKNLSFSVVPGRRVAIVGGSGSGKTTVGRLAAGLFDPTAGEIHMDGRPRSEIPRNVLAASVTYVDQEACLFEGTVRDNVTLWDESISDDAVIAALRDAAVFDLIAARPGGINSQVSEGGRNFSGGQRQRLEIARAMVTEPSLLILDEATSALDPETERIVADNLRRRGCACLIIAHRLSTVRDADEIIVLTHGEITERGRHDELAAADGTYAALIAAGGQEVPQ
ncbi:NHLP family bacteriocin export ABC transporter peptidase/permease/ATPase subunit [Nonomuraea sp. LPB2021202275-12-8]|uniref:NHLP family bacteriocin export ABC transporter peptidase/permease/ATPase subunit n=1 Tax=Nonomuraea sp. LPB2021202275-12-8 TaxID=3120159 RepID=UPI00300C6A1F